MLKNTLDMLRSDDFYGTSERIETAKGNKRKPTSTKEVLRQAKRQIKWLISKK